MTQSPTTVLGAAIAAPIEQFMAAFSRGDAAGAAVRHTADAQVLPPTAMSSLASRRSRHSGRGPWTWASRQSSWQPSKW